MSIALLSYSAAYRPPADGRSGHVKTDDWYRQLGRRRRAHAREGGSPAEYRFSRQVKGLQVRLLGQAALTAALVAFVRLLESDIHHTGTAIFAVVMAILGLYGIYHGAYEETEAMHEWFDHRNEYKGYSDPGPASGDRPS